MYLGTPVGIGGDPERFRNVLKKIVRGLFYLDTRTVMPGDVRWGFEQITRRARRLQRRRFDLIRPMPLRTVGEVVKYIVRHRPWRVATDACVAGFLRTHDVLGPHPPGGQLPVRRRVERAANLRRVGATIPSHSVRAPQMGPRACRGGAADPRVTGSAVRRVGRPPRRTDGEAAAHLLQGMRAPRHGLLLGQRGWRPGQR